MKEIKNAFSSYYIYRQCCVMSFLEFGKDITIKRPFFNQKTFGQIDNQAGVVCQRFVCDFSKQEIKKRIPQNHAQTDTCPIYNI